MKKTLLIALAGLMMFAFTQCHSGGSKEFKDRKALLQKMEKVFKNEKDCEKLFKKLEKIGKEYDKKKYADKDKITKEEEKELKKIVESMEKTVKKNECMKALEELGAGLDGLGLF